VILSVFGFSFGIFILILRLIYGPEWAAAGVFTLFALLFIFVGVQFLGMGLLGEYLGRMYYDVRERPRYIISHIVGKSRLTHQEIEEDCIARVN
jgi:undecaprenyl-phosphate 4-deoxy-4-formamido-L-arabinose transferase